MLDTRNLSYFTHPEDLIMISNAWVPEHQFSPWGKDSVNLVVSDLLREHIRACISVEGNIDKLYATMITMGMRKTNQMLILTTDRKFALFEPDGEKSVKLCFGEYLKTGEPGIFAKSRCVFLPAASGDPNAAWVKMEEIVANKDLDVKSQVNKDKGMTIRDAIADTLSAYCNLFLFLQFVETEVVEIEPKQKFQAKKYEGFKNQQSVKICVADLSWSRETLGKIPSLVSGHLRQQPCGPGRLERKLIYIEPFQRTHHRRSGKDRAIKQ